MQLNLLNSLERGDQGVCAVQGVCAEKGVCAGFGGLCPGACVCPLWDGAGVGAMEAGFRQQRKHRRRLRAASRLERGMGLPIKSPDIVLSVDVLDRRDDLVEDTTHPKGKHRTHGSRSKSSLVTDFKKVFVADQFAKETLEGSLWYATEFFLTKQGYSRLKEPTDKLVPHLVNWCRGANFPAIERFQRTKDKDVEMRKAKHIKVRRVILKALSRAGTGAFHKSVKYYLAGGVRDVAQGRFWNVVKKCFGLDVLSKELSDFVDAKTVVMLAGVDRRIDSKLLSLQVAARGYVRNDLAGDVGKASKDTIMAMFEGVTDTVRSLLSPLWEWIKVNKRILLVTTFVIGGSAVLFSMDNPLPTKFFFGETVAEAVSDDVAQSFGVTISVAEIVSWLNKCAKEIRDVKTIVEAAKMLWSSLMAIIDCAWEAMFGLPFTSRGRAKKGILESVNELVERLEVYDPSAPSDEEKDSGYADAYRELLGKSKLLMFDKELHASVQALLVRYCNDYFTALGRLSLGRTRQVPFCIYISGPAGTGKSTMVQPIVNTLYAEEHGEEAEEYSPRWKYDWKSANEFQDTYDNQFAILIDDAFQLVDPSMRMKEAIELISIVNTAPYPIHAAAVEKKGKTFCVSKLVILTSNDNKFHDLGITDLGALTRRLHCKIYPLDEGLFDVEFLDGIVNGFPYWAYYKAVDPEDLDMMLRNAYHHYRTVPAPSTATVKTMVASMKPMESLSFGDLLPTGFTRGDRQCVDKSGLVSTLKAEKAFVPPRKIPKAPRARRPVPVKEVKKKEFDNSKPQDAVNLPDGDEKVDLVPEVLIEDVEDEAQSRTMVIATIPLRNGRNLQLILDEVSVLPHRQVQYSSKDAYGTGCLDRTMLCVENPLENPAGCDDVERNKEEVNRAFRLFVKTYTRKPLNVVEAEAYEKEFTMHQLLSLYPSRASIVDDNQQPIALEFLYPLTPGMKINLKTSVSSSVCKYLALFLAQAEYWLTDEANAGEASIIVGIGSYLAFLALFTALRIAMTKMGFLVSKPVDVAQSDDKFISRVQKMRAKQVRRAVAQPKDMAQSLEAAPEHLKNDLAKIMANSLQYSIAYPNELNIQMQGGTLFFVRGGLAMTTLHGFRRDKDGKFLSGKGMIHVEQERLVFDPAKLEEENRLFTVPECDRVWMVLSGFNAMCIRRLFRNRITEPDNMMTVLVDKAYATSSSYTTDVRSEGEMTYKKKDGTAVTAKRIFVATGIPGAAGDCGRVFFEKTETEVSVVGMHVAGGSGRSLVAHVMREEVDKVYEHFRATLHQRDKVYLAASEAIDECQGGIFKPKIGTYQTWPVIGMSPKRHFTPTQSGFSRSFLVDEHYGEPLFPVETTPALLRENNGVDPVAKYASNFVGKQSQDYFPHMHDPEVWKGVFPRSSYQKKYQKFTFEQVVYMARMIGLEPLCRTTSAGGRWVLIGVTREQLLDVDSMWHMELRKAVEKIIATLEEGVVPFELHILHPKDEPKSHEKVAVGDTRYFLIGSLEMQIVYRMYFGWFLVQQQVFRMETDIQVGINCYSEDWHLLAMRFAGQKCSDADIKKWDVNFPRRIAYSMPYVASRIWDVPCFEMQLLLIAAMQCKALIGNVIVLMFLLPSGFLLTAWLNSVINSVAHRSIAKEMQIVFSLGVFGDDSLVSWSAEGNVLEEIIRLRELWYGWISTSADKTGAPTEKDILECQFLKRGFVLDKDSGRIVAPLDTASIRKMLTWVQARTEPEMVQKTIQNLRVAFMEGSLHDESYFEQLVERVKVRWLQVAPRTYEVYDYSSSRYNTLHLETRL